MIKSINEVTEYEKYEKPNEPWTKEETNRLTKAVLKRQREDERKTIFTQVALALISNYPGMSDTNELFRRTGEISTAILAAADEYAKGKK